MNVEPISRFLLTTLTILALAACGGGGGGGGGSLVSGGGAGGGSDDDETTGTITLTISGMVDENGDPDSVLAGNEVATLTAQVTENGQPAELVVLFETTIGRLLQSSAEAVGGEASVEIEGTGEAGAATVTATATLSNGAEVTDSITVQTSADGPNLELFDANGEEATALELLAAESVTLTARVLDWDNDPLEDVNVSFTASAVTIDKTADVTDANGEIEIVLTGTETVASGTFDAAATFDSFELSDSITANSLGVDTAANNITIGTIDLGTDGVLDGNEKRDINITVLEDGTGQDGISVTFAVTSGAATLNPTSATTSGGGLASIQVIGSGEAGTVEITASATLNNGIAVQDTQTIQTTAVTPTVTLTIRDQAGTETTNFGANQVLTLEAVIADYDGSTLDSEDAGVVVTFDVANLGTVTNTTDVAERNVCPVDLIKIDNDCAWVAMTSNATAAVSEIVASATINGIAIEDRVVVTNTGINSGSPDQDSFSVTRTYNGESFALSDAVATEGDQFNGEEVQIRVDLADYASNPVPDGTLVNFRTELGDIEEECSTVSGSCEVSFITSEPRTPINSEVSFKNLEDDNCPSDLIFDERVTIDADDQGYTQYRVAEILRVYRELTGTYVTEGVQYLPAAHGIDCIACTPGQFYDITYRRLWLDEEDDGASTHVLAAPGVATEPFLDVVDTPCTAPRRESREVITGSIDPDGSTAITGVGTAFKLELSAGDRLKLGQEVRTVTAVTSDTALTVDVAFSDTGNDVSPERIAAPAYQGGMGQPYGGRSTILAFTLGEESFVDANGNDEYDFGESFEDLTEVFLDKNEDGVLGDVDADSSTAGITGPYRDGGLGSDAPGQAREKSNPGCYGPRTIIGASGDGDESTEAEEYCFQYGGEEELFIDGGSENGVMDVGNGIYNGSRCLNPLQDADGIDQGNDGDLEDDTVCTTELVNISRQVQILLAGSSAKTEFRAVDADLEGGTFGLGEIINGIVNRSGLTVNGSVADPVNWSRIDTNLVQVTTLADSFPGAPFGGALIDTTVLDVSANGAADSEELVGLFEVPDPFPTTYASYTVSFDIVEWTAGSVEVYVGSDLIVAACGGAAGVTTTCTASDITISPSDTLRFVVADTDAGAGVNATFEATITNITVSGVTTGVDGDFQSDVNLVANNKSTTSLTEFNVGDTLDGTTIYPGVSERLAPSGVLPTLTTTITAGIFLFTDRYNGRLPEGTTVTISSSNETGCSLTSVGGTTIAFPPPGALTGGPHEGVVTVGQDVTTATTFAVQTGGGGNGTITATVTTPTGTSTTHSIACNLLL